MKLSLKKNRRQRGVLLAAAVLVAGVSPGIAGVLDLSNNVLIYRGTALTQASHLAQVQALTLSGFNGGTWDGPGINSSTAATAATLGHYVLGVVALDNTLATYSTFAGVSGLDATGCEQVLAMATFYGDLDLSGSVDPTDYGILDTALTTQDLQFDVNHDGVIDAADYGLMDTCLADQAHFSSALQLLAVSGGAVASTDSTGGAVLGSVGGGGGALLAPVISVAANVNAEASGPSPVPEPGAVGLLVVGAIGLMNFRRK